MKYLNTSGSHLRVSEDRVVAPNTEVYLSDEEENSLEVLKAKDFSWLTPVVENIVGDFIQGEINKIEGNKPSPINNPFPLIVPGVTGINKPNKPNKTDVKVDVDVSNSIEGNNSAEVLTKEQKLYNDMKQKAIEDAVKKASVNNINKTKKSWNPMDNAVKGGEPDYVIDSDKEVNSSKGYGNVELKYDELPTAFTNEGNSSISKIAYINHDVFSESEVSEDNNDVDDIKDVQKSSSNIKDINNKGKK